LVKVRFMGADRDQRAILTSQLVEGTTSTFAGSVGSTALFYRPKVEIV
jgi:RNA-binding protein YhbY